MKRSIVAGIYFLVLISCYCGNLQAQSPANCKASITADGPTSICSGTSVKLTVNQAGLTYTWYKGNTVISGQKGAFITVTESGDYAVSIDNHATCKPEDTKSVVLKVTVNDNPVPGFTFPSGDQCAGSAVTFTNTSTGTKLTYRWDFGDPASGAANTSTSASPSHTYKGFLGSSKEFTVKLTVRNEAGCERTTEQKIRVKEGPDASLRDPDVGQFDTPFVRCTTNPNDINYTVNIVNNSTTKTINQSYSVNWGDGSPTVNLGANFTTATHTYTRRGGFPMVFTVTSSSGCTSATTYEVYNGSNPSLAVGSPGNTVGCAPETYTFPISGVSNNSPATLYTFRFDDGSDPYIFTQENIPNSITHTFRSGSCGTNVTNAYTLVATAENPCGTTPITVGSIRIASGPQAKFDLPMEVVCVNQPVKLNNTTISGNTFTNTGNCVNNSVFAWDIQPATGWTFKAGSTSGSEFPELIFTQPGLYRLKLSASNSCGQTEDTHDIKVITPPTAVFSLTPAEGCRNLQVTTNNSSTGDELRYTWTVSPNTGYTLVSGTLTSINPVFNFTDIGDYTLTLEAKNDCQTSTATTSLKVRDKPTAALPPDQGYCSPQTIKFNSSNTVHAPAFTANNGTISAYKWTVSGAATFVSGTSASSMHPEINFPADGVYTVTVVATSECGDSEAATQKVTIAPGILGNVLAADQTVCSGTAPASISSAEPTGGQGPGSYTYTWEYSTTSATAGFQAVADARARDYTPTGLTETTWFRRTVASGGCNDLSNVVKITVTPSPAAPTVNGKTVCTGSIVVLRVENPNVTYEWFSDETSTTPLHTGPTYDTPVLNSTTTYYVHTKGSQGCPSTRTPVTITIDPGILANDIGDNQAICTGEKPQDLIGSTPTGGSGTFTYLWEFSTDNSTFAAAPGVNTSKDYQPPVLQQETWYRRRVSSGSCESISAPVQIAVNGLIANNNISALQTICTGSRPAPLSGSIPTGGDGSYTYRWEVSTDGPTGIFAAAPGENDKAGYSPEVLTQTSWFRRVVLSNICSNPSAAAEITVNEIIANNLLSQEQTVCLGSSGTNIAAALPTGGNGSYTYLWEVSTLSATAGFVPAPGRNDEQDYTTASLTQTSWFRRRVTSAPCAAHTSEAVRITVNAAITGNVVSGEAAICSGTAPAEFTGTTPAGGSGTYVYLWESSTTGPTTGFAPAAGMNNGETYQSGTLTETTWFRRSVLSEPCTPLASNAVKVTIIPVISANSVSAPQTICTGKVPAALTGSTPAGGDGSYTYTWEFSTDGVSYSTAPGRNNLAGYAPLALTQSTWFRRVVTSGDCSNSSDAVQIIVNEEISANTITQDQLICVGATPVELFGSDPQGGDGTYTYVWESSTTGPATGFGAAAGKHDGQHYAPAAITQSTWFRRVVMAGPCAASYSMPVKITVTPPLANNTIATPQSICEGTMPAALRGTTPTGGNGTYTFVWETSTTGPNGGFAPAAGVNDGLHYNPGQVPVTTWFRRTVYSEGCTNVTAAIQITVVQPVANNTIISDQLVCIGTAPATLAGTPPIGGNGNYTYRWEISADNVTFLPAPGTRDEMHYIPRPLNVNTWFRRVVMAGPCAEAVSNVVKVTVNAPVSNNTIGSPQRICAGTRPGILHGSAPTGGSGTYSYLWEWSTTSGTTGFTPAPGTNNQAGYEPDKLSRTTWFRRKIVSLPCQESISFAVVITVDPQPTPPQTRGITFCPGETATLTAAALAATDAIEWFDQAEGGIPIQRGGSYTTPPLLATTDYFVQTVNQFGCASERSRVTATVIIPAADAGPDVSITKGQSTQLRAKGGRTYTWSPAAGLTNPNIADPVANPEETTTYTVTVTSAEGCTFTDEITVTVLPAIRITNTLTLNGDGLNEVWFIENIEFYPNCQVQVFSRWGARIFESVGYKTPWDGTQNGKPLPMTAYYYIIRLNEKEAPLSGSITLIK